MTNVLISSYSKGVRTLSSPGAAALLLGYLFILVMITTISQVYVGLFLAKKMIMDSWFIWITIKGHLIPIAPGGWLDGSLLLVSLVLAVLTRIPFKLHKIGLWAVHLGGIALILGAGLSSGLSRDAQLVLDEGQSKNYAQMTREAEVAVQISTPGKLTEVLFSQESALKKGAVLKDKKLPFELYVLSAYPNSKMVASEEEKKQAVPNLSTMGAGTGVMIVSQKPVTSDDYRNDPSIYVDLVSKGKSQGRYLLSNIVESGQMVMIENQTYVIAFRPKRLYLPIDVALTEFQHRQYPGTTVPSWFASKVMIFNPITKEKREVLISMNHPLRYEGNTLYQASFGKNDTQTLLQVVNNPTWLLPYFSCALMGLGLIFHFFISFTRVKQGDQ